MPTADPFAGLRIGPHGVVVIDRNIVFRCEIIGVHSLPVTLQRLAQGMFVHRSLWSFDSECRRYTTVAGVYAKPICCVKLRVAPGAICITPGLSLNSPSKSTGLA